MALTQDGEVWVWGSNEFGALGAGQDTDRELIPVKLELPPCKYISASAEHSVALSNDNKLYAWGKNTALQLGPDLDKISGIVAPQNVSVPDLSEIVKPS